MAVVFFAYQFIYIKQLQIEIDIERMASIRSEKPHHEKRILR